MELEEIPFRRDNSGYHPGKRTQLFLYDEKSGEIKVLTAPDLNVREITLHRQDARVLIRANDRSGQYRHMAGLCDDIYELDLKTLSLTLLYGAKDLNIGKTFYWHEEVFVLASDMREFGLNQNYSLYRITQGQSTRVGGEEIIYGNSVGSDVRMGKQNIFLVQDDNVFYLSTLEGEGVLRLLHQQGEAEIILRGAGSVDSFAFVDGNLYVIGLFANRPQEIYMLKQEESFQVDQTAEALLVSVQQNRKEANPERLAAESLFVSDQHKQEGANPEKQEVKTSAEEDQQHVRTGDLQNQPIMTYSDLLMRKARNSGDLLRLTHFNDAAMAGIWPSDPVKLEIESNGDMINGWVLLPRGFDPLASYPGILSIHGGPKTAYGTAFFHEMQLWANDGYFVFFCNPHGSDGEGDAFADIRGKYGSVDFHDLMNFTDAVLEKYPQLDTNRLGVSGGSYGGFMTNWIISHTDSFKAAVTQRSITNWLSFYGTSDIGYYFAEDQMAADFFSRQGIEQLWQYSPLSYAAQINTPALIIHSKEDYRCPLEQGYQLFTALKVRGVDSKMLVFKDESHELSRSGKPLARIERLKQITLWFNHYLQP
ncbi:MAG TPA: S9 family peptidase [Clostridiaceae bacterium]|nr:S9 family peptidase [Clostridiaceae bacterium]